MKRFYISLVPVILMSCVFFGKSDRARFEKLPDKSDFISFKIDNSPSENGNVRIKLIFENISGTNIIIYKPTCWGRTIMPFITDSSGMSLPSKKIRSACIPESIPILMGKEYMTIFGYELEEWFDLTKPGVYQIFFKYYGSILDNDNNIIANETPITSNAIGFEI